MPLGKKLPPEIVIGVDESGIGAIAGPFTVCAYASAYNDGAHLLGAGARDSKKLSHAKRLRVIDELVGYGACVALEAVPHDFADQRVAWRSAIATAVLRVVHRLALRPGGADLFIDGVEDRRLLGYLSRVALQPIFLVRGEDACPQVAAASIFAKVWRSELMERAHREFPVYGWSGASGHGNDGYGTEDHFAAIKEHGISPLHRRVRPLVPYFEAKEAALRGETSSQLSGRREGGHLCEGDRSL